MHHVQSEALRLFLESGYERTTIEEIAEPAEVSPSLVYRYFGTKEGIVLHDEYVVPWQDAMTTELAEHPPVTAARRAMRSVFTRYFSQADELPQDLLDLVFSEPALQAALAQQLEVLVDDISRTLRASTGARVESFDVDLSDQSSVCGLAVTVPERLSNLDVVVHNAGVIESDRRESVDGVEMTWAVNTLAPFLLTSELIDLLIANRPARVVMVASVGHTYIDSIQSDDFEFEQTWSGLDASPVRAGPIRE